MNIFSLYALAPQFRERRRRLFERMIQPKASDRLLDVGGSPGDWPKVPCRVTTCNLYAAQSTAFARHEIANGCALPYRSGSFDIGYSNSVIEHVGNYDRQLQFACEISRVCRKLWVQTPAFAFPIEPHYLAPFIHWLPRFLRRPALYLTPWYWLQKPSKAEMDEMIQTTRILTKWEMQMLFPSCEIIVERFLGIPKSYIAVRD